MPTDAEDAGVVGSVVIRGTAGAVLTIHPMDAPAAFTFTTQEGVAALTIMRDGSVRAHAEGDTQNRPGLADALHAWLRVACGWKSFMLGFPEVDAQAAEARGLAEILELPYPPYELHEPHGVRVAIHFGPTVIYTAAETTAPWAEAVAVLQAMARKQVLGERSAELRAYVQDRDAAATSEDDL